MRRIFLLLPLLALAAGTLSSCGEDEASAAELVRRSSAVTSEAGSARITYSAEITDIPGSPEDFEAIEFGGDGTLDFASQSGDLTLTLPEVPGLPQGITMETVFAGTTSYLRSEIFGPLPDGADWVAFDIETVLDEQAGVDISQLPSYGSDPANSLALLEGASEDGVEEVGEEDVAGVTTTHYRAEIDVAQQYEDSDAITDPEAFEAFRDQLGDEPIDIDVWIDDEGRVLRQRYEQPLPTPEGSGTMEITIELSDFGAEVDIDLPDEGDTVDILDLLPDA